MWGQGEGLGRGIGELESEVPTWASWRTGSPSGRGAGIGSCLGGGGVRVPGDEALPEARGGRQVTVAMPGLVF